MQLSFNYYNSAFMMIGFNVCRYFIVWMLLVSCATPIKNTHSSTSKPKPRLNPKTLKVDTKIFKDGANLQLLLDAEADAEPANAKVLEQGRVMTVNKRVIVRGGCWDYIDAIWNKAGFPIKKRHTVFKSSKSGPYAKPAKIHSGDWLYFINHSYKNIQHSSMFIAWANKQAMRGYVLSYAGQRRKESARYKIYDLRSVYQVIRPK